eukprot:1225931-Karenia_brevis.AAC.1
MELRSFLQIMTTCDVAGACFPLYHNTHDDTDDAGYEADQMTLTTMMMMMMITPLMMVVIMIMVVM